MWENGSGYLQGFRLVHTDSSQTALDFGRTNYMRARAPDDVYAMDGPVTWISAHRDGSYVYGIRMDVDHCACVSTSIELDYVPDFTWTLRSEPSDHYLDWYIPTAPAWPNLDPTTNSCYPQWVLDDLELDDEDDTYGVVWVDGNN